MLLEDGTGREHTRMNSLGPHVQFLVKLVRTALMCKFDIKPRESSLFPVSACRSGLSLSQQDLVGVCQWLQGDSVVCVFVGWSLLCSTWGTVLCLLLSNQGLPQLPGLLWKDSNPRQLCNSALHVLTD